MKVTTRHIRVRRLEGITVVTFVELPRAVCDDESIVEIGREMSGLFEPGSPRKVVLDFEGVAFAPYAHFEGKLVSLQSRIERDGGLMIMANLHPSVRNHFHVHHLDRFFIIHDSIEEAMRAFPGVEADRTP